MSTSGIPDDFPSPCGARVSRACQFQGGVEGGLQAQQQADSEPDWQTHGDAPSLVGTSQLFPASTMASGGSDIPVQPSSQPGPLNQVAAAEMEDKCCESGALAELIANFPPDLSLTLREVVALNVIPHILHNLDTTTMERFASVCRKAHALTDAHP